MSEEPWDELMGPPPSRPTLASFDRKNATMDPPSSNNNNNTYDNEYSTSNRWSYYESEVLKSEKDAATNQAVYTASNAFAEREMENKSVSDASDDEYHKAFKNGGGDSGSVGSSSNNNNKFVVDHDTIRQEALRMLEVADADRNYNVHRTISGGFSATAKTKTRAALSGINFSNVGRKNIGRSFRDDPFVNTVKQQEQIDYDNNNNDDDNVVDIDSMERRGLSNRESDQDNKPNAWSSRYSIDNTLLAMTGGTVSKNSVSDMRVYNDPYSTSNARILDRMDKESRNGGFIKGAIFGSSAAFNFGQKNVFGKQNVSLPPPQSSRQPNLHAAFLNNDNDNIGTSLPPVNHRTKTWQEKLQQRRLQNRILQSIGICLLIFISIISIVIIKRKHDLSSLSSLSESVTFYVTSDIPLLPTDESKLYHSLNTMSDQTNFVVHVGNIQKASITKCNVTHYKQVADMLIKSSPVTMFVIPGKEDWTECPNPNDAWDNWYNSFILLNEKFNKTGVDKIITYHEKNHLENWAFIQKNVLFIGIHEVGGIIVDQNEFTTRNERNYKWVESMLNTHYNNDNIRSLVIFGNAKPGLPQNTMFFAPLGDLLGTNNYNKLPTLYIHSSSDSKSNGTLYQPLNNIPTLKAVSSYTTGSNIVSPLLRINVGYGNNPFIIG